MEFINTSIRLFATSQFFLFVILVVASDNPRRVRGTATMLAIGIAAYLIMPLARTYTPYWNQLGFLWFFASISPSLLLLLVWFIFEEDCRVPIWLSATVGISVLGSIWFHLINVTLSDSPVWLQGLKIFVSAMAIYVVWQGRDSDLVELRSKIRNVFILVMAAMMMIVIAMEVVTEFNPPQGLDTFVVLIIFLFSVALNYFFTKLDPVAQPMAAPLPPREESGDPLIKELLTRMSSERLYADHDLRVGSLAGLMNIPEYKLRKKINQQLGYRNFNQFVNHYRIQEAGVKLREDLQTPVLSIALDVGFRSISSFNSAFQAQFGVSPTKYRAEIAG